ncbi:sugar transporter, partial [Pseudomonas sp. JV245A]|nr:sugar transporter [Pseudomonas sp. JV245A]
LGSWVGGQLGFAYVGLAGGALATLALLLYSLALGRMSRTSV